MLVRTLACVDKGVFFVRVANLSSGDIYLKPQTQIGVLHTVDHIESGSSIGFTRKSPSEEQIYLQETSAQTEGSVGQTALPVDLDNADCTKEQREQLAKLLKKYEDLFVTEDEDLGFTDKVKHRTLTTDDKPVNQPFHRIPFSQYQEVRNHIKKLLDKGIIRESSSPYASPSVVVRKKDSSLRLCVDYRELNAKTIKDAYPLPRIEESWEALKGAKFFSTLDLFSSYHQVAMDPQDVHKTAFCTPFGLYESTRLNFGLCNAPATF